MIELAWERHRRLRLWWNSFPDALYAAEGTLTKKLPAVGVSTSPRMAALEVLLPRGGIILYGLVGLECSPARVESCVVSVGVATPQRHKYVDSLAHAVDDLYVGLPEELGQAVVAGVQQAATTSAVWPAISITCRCAAYGPIGSVPQVYAAVAATIATLLVTDSPHKDAALTGLLNQALERDYFSRKTVS